VSGAAEGVRDILSPPWRYKNRARTYTRKTASSFEDIVRHTQRPCKGCLRSRLHWRWVVFSGGPPVLAE
jgi:hypothetical protein